MSEKRRDKRGRILRNGEIQMENGRYRFKYTDSLGQKWCTSDSNDRRSCGVLQTYHPEQSKAQNRTNDRWSCGVYILG